MASPAKIMRQVNAKELKVVYLQDQKVIDTMYLIRVPNQSMRLWGKYHKFTFGDV